MPVSALLVAVTDVQALLRVTQNADDAYAKLIISQASNAVRHAGVKAGIAEAAGWVTATEPDEPGTGQVQRPDVARDVALWVASRAYVNPKNLERRTSGPISETFRDSGVYGVELTDDERDRIGTLAGTSSTGGLWVQPISYGTEVVPILAPSDMPIPGDSFVLGDSDDFPYADPEGEIL